MNEPDSRPQLHRDLVRADAAGFATLAFGVLGLGFGVAFGWGSRLLCAALWKDLASGSAWKEWGLGSWIIGPVMCLIFLALTVISVIGGIVFIFAWGSSLSGKLSEEDLAWRRRATSVEAASPPRPGILRVTRITDGLGAHSAGRRFSFPIELVALEGQEDLSVFQKLLVRQASEFGSNQNSKKLSELSKSDSLLDQLIDRHRDRREQQPTTERGRSIESVTLPANFKVDPANPPEIVVVEIDSTRLWCGIARSKPAIDGL